MTSLLLSDMIYFVRSLLGDNVNFTAIAPDSVVGQDYDDGMITDAVNEAIRLYCEMKPQSTYIETSATTPTGGRLTAPADYLHVRRVVYAGNVLAKSSQEFEVMTNPAYSTTIGTATRRWYWVDSNTIGLSPLLSSWAASAVIGYIQMPALLVSTVQTAPVDARINFNHQEYLKYAAAAYLLQMENDQQSLQMAEAFMAEFKNLIGAD